MKFVTDPIPCLQNFRVATSLFVYITVAHWWNILITIYFPLLWHKWKLYRERLKLRLEIRNLEVSERAERSGGGLRKTSIPKITTTLN